MLTYRHNGEKENIMNTYIIDRSIKAASYRKTLSAIIMAIQGNWQRWKKTKH